MTTELVDIRPNELRFMFEVKKQSSCSIQLCNKSDHYVAFKVKTTSPKKYCVQPNIGIIKPNTACDFTVTMEAQGVAPPDMLCKDKFLIQSMVVPFGTSEEDITSNMFTKESSRYVEEKKIKVVLVSPVQSPVLLPINGEPMNQDPYIETAVRKDRISSGVENIPPPNRVSKHPFQGAEDVKESEAAYGAGHTRAIKDDLRPKHGDNFEQSKVVANLNLLEDLDALKLKLCIMNSKLKEAEYTVTKLMEERSMATREKDLLKQDLELLRKNGVRKVQVGFPFFCVIMVALTGLVVGYLFHP